MASGRTSERAFFGVSALLFAASAAGTIVWCTCSFTPFETTSPMGPVGYAKSMKVSFRFVRGPHVAFLMATHAHAAAAAPNRDNVATGESVALPPLELANLLIRLKKECCPGAGWNLSLIWGT
jgi:hypothetical protein